MSYRQLFILIVFLIFSSMALMSCSTTDSSNTNNNVTLPDNDTQNPGNNGSGGGDIGDAGTDIKWDNLPSSPIVSADKVFDSSDMGSPATPVTPGDIVALVGKYRIAYTSVESPDGTKIIDNIIGSGDNMRGEFAVNAGACTPEMGIKCVAGVNLAIAIQVKFQFNSNLLGVPDSIKFLRKNIYKPLSSLTDIAGEFTKLGADVIEDTNNPGKYLVKFTMSSPDIPMPKDYKMVFILKKEQDDTLLNSKITLNDDKYFSDSTNVTAVALSQSSAELVAEDELQLTHTITPVNASNKNVTYSSSDESIATVDSTGKVKAHKAGTVTITVTTADGNKTASCEITITPKPIEVTSLEFQDETVTLDLDLAAPSKRTKTLTVTILPEDATNKNISFSANTSGIVSIGSTQRNGNIVTVDITAVKAGNVKITAESINGKKDICDVTVIDSTIHPESVSLNINSKELNVNETTQLTATVTPSSAHTKSVTYSSNNINIATVNSEGLVTAKSAGNAIITVTTVDGGKTATCNITVKEPVIQVKNIQIPATKNMSEDTSSPDSTWDMANTVVVIPNNATNKSVTYLSSDINVVTVTSEGLVTAISDGTATITVTSVDDSSITAQCLITVAADVTPVIHVTRISITNKATPAELKVGETYSLNVEVTPFMADDKTYRFESDNSSIAEVDNKGNITVKNIDGNVTIKVISIDNSSAIDTYTLYAWKPNNLSGSYNVKSLKIVTDAGDTIESAGANADEAKANVTINHDSSVNTLELAGKFQIVSSVMYNRPELDTFRYRYFTDKILSLSERDTAKDKFAVKGYIINDDGTITLSFRDVTNAATITMILERLGDYTSLIEDKRYFVTKINFADPKSLEGTYDIVKFGQKNGAGVNLGYEYPGTLQRMTGELTMLVARTDSTTVKITMRSKIQMNSSTLHNYCAGLVINGKCIGVYAAREEQYQNTSYDALDYWIPFGNESDKEDFLFGTTGKQTNGKVYKDSSANLKIYQQFTKIGVGVEVNVFVNKKDDKIKELDNMNLYWCENKNITPSGSVCPNPEPDPSFGLIE